MLRHALFAIPVAGPTFRIGQPTDWNNAVARWSRLDDRRAGMNGTPARAIRVRHDGRDYAVKSLEVRAVDAHGRGLGSGRHETAFPVPYRALRSAR